MKQVQWTSKDGYLHRSLLKDDMSEDKPEYGVPIGPPDISLIDWEEVKREVNNILVRENVSTWTELTQSTVAMPEVAAIMRRHVATLYREYAGR